MAQGRATLPETRPAPNRPRKPLLVRATKKVRGKVDWPWLESLHQEAFAVLVGQTRTARAGQVAVLSNRVARRMLRARPGVIRIRVDRLLQGSQAGLTVDEFAQRIDSPGWGSRRVIDGPHARLLGLAAGSPNSLTDAELRGTDYWRLTQDSVTASGSFFGARSDSEILQVARNYIEWAFKGARRQTPTPGSRIGEAIVVAPVIGSRHYSVVDGHHRAGFLAFTGEETVTVKRTWLQVRTPLQLHLGKMSWLQGERNRLYQPIDAPEIEQSWITVRRCTDRFEKMRRVLDRSPDADDGIKRTYLDVASCYGWFVNAMADIGYNTMGLEQDELAPALGESVYGLDRSQIVTADAIQWLSDQSDRRWDVVSCFSLIHHFLRDGGIDEVGRFLRLLDGVTGSVLFIDSGQEHEISRGEWSRGWDTEAIIRCLQETTTFELIEDLGPDEDGVAPYGGDYGRHLFACSRRA